MNTANVTTDILRLLDLEGDTKLLGKLGTIVQGVASALSLRLGVSEVPDALSYIVRDVSLARYNRIGSEGASAHEVEGERLTYAGADDFSPYALDIELWKEENAKAKVRRVHFL